MSGRIGLGAAVLALIGWAAAAAPIPGTDQQLGSWIVQADDDGSGKFAYCDATRDGGGPLVHIGQSASGSWQIGFTNADWQFAVGQDVTVTLFIDRVPYPLVLRTLSPTTFSTPLPDTTLVDALRQGDMLTLQLGAVYTTFSLDGSTAVALGLPPQDSACLLRFASPLSMTMSQRRHDHRLYLLVRVLGFAGAKLIESWPQGGDHRIDHLSGHIQEAKRIRLGFIG